MELMGRLLLETCWRLTHGRVFDCAIYRTDVPGLEVRCIYAGDDLIGSERSAEMDSARILAERWRQAVLVRGGFSPAGQ